MNSLRVVGMLMLAGATFLAQQSRADLALGDTPVLSNIYHHKADLSSEYLPESADAASGPLDRSTADSSIRMVYQSYQNGLYVIVAADADGNSKSTLTSGFEFARSPALRNAGTDIAYVAGGNSSRSLRVVRKDGADNVPLTGEGSFGGPAWSEDGLKLAYSNSDGQRTRIYSAAFNPISRTLGSPACLTCLLGRSVVSPAWSPDGRRIAYIEVSPTEPRGSVWVMQADGSMPQQFSGELWWLSNLRWSPDGASIGFDHALARDAWNRIAVISLIDRQLRTVHDPNADLVDAWMGGWSPDGALIYYTRVEYSINGGSLAIAHSWLERVAAGGGVAVRLPGSTGTDSAPVLARRDLIAPQSQVDGITTFRRIGGFTPRISAFDTGGSKLRDVAVQSRVAGGNWQAYDPATLRAGNTLEFMSSARDNEGNIESYPAVPDTATTLFRAEIQTAFTDNRGWPLPNTQVTSSNIAVDSQSVSQGAQTRWKFGDVDRAAFTATHEGMQSREMSAREIVDGGMLTSYLSPFAPVFAEDFENPVLAQTVTLDLATPARYAAHSGQFGLDMPFARSLRRELPADPSSHDAGMWVDREGNVMLLRYSNQEPLRLQFMSGLLTWPVSYTAVFSPDQFTPRAYFPDEEGGLYIVHGAPNMAIQVCHVLQNGLPCQNEILDLDVFSPNATGQVDHAGTAHLIWTSPTKGALQYAFRVRGGTWSTPVSVGGLRYAGRVSSAIDSSGTLHVVMRATWTWLYLKKPLGGTWTEPVTLVVENPECGYPATLAAAGNGDLYFVLEVCGTQGYFRKSMTQTNWMAVAGPNEAVTRLVGRPNGDFHALLVRGGVGRRVASQRAGSTAWEVQEIPDATSATFSSDGVPYAVFQSSGDRRSIAAYDFDRIAASAASAYSLQITLPLTMPRQTLAFMYATLGTADNENPLQLKISSAHKNVDADLPETAGSWTLFNTPLDGFAGSSITLTIGPKILREVSDRRAMIDALTISDWSTPVVTQSSVVWLPAGYASTPVVLSGSNFVSGTQMFIGLNVSLAGLSVQSDGHALANIPSGVPPGLHTLRVRNPDGRESLWPGFIAVGQQSYMPVVLAQP